MMKKYILVLLTISVICISSCDRNKGRMPDESVAEEITEFSPITSIQTVIARMDSIDWAKIGSLLPKRTSLANKTFYNSAYALGVIHTDLILASKARQRNVVTGLFPSIIALADTLDWEKQAGLVSSSMQEFLVANSWTDIQEALIQLKQKYEAAAWESQNYELYSLYLAGQWNELLKLLATYYSDSELSYNSNALIDPSIWTTIHSNLQMATSEDLVSTRWYQTMYNEIGKLSSLLNGDIHSSQAVSWDQILANTTLINSIVIYSNEN